MKLWYSAASPFVRKILILAHETSLVDQLEIVDAASTAIAPNSELAAENPLGKIPTLVTDQGQSIFDSRVICEYLDGMHDGERMIPESGEARLNSLVAQSMGDGVMEAAVAIRYEQFLRPKEKQWDDWIGGQARKIRQTLDVLETWRPGRMQDIHIGSIAVASALSYLDFRQPEFDWRDGHPVLTQMLGTFSKRNSMLETDPQKG